VPLKERVPMLRTRRFRGTVGNRPFWFTDRSELGAVVEVFRDRDYGVALDAEPRTIVDLGANVGQASLYFRQAYPGARIIAVEADPMTFATLAKNLGRDAMVKLRHCAITPRDEGPVRLSRLPNESWATRVGATGEVVVPGMSLDRLLDEEHLTVVDLLKVDIEGLEIDVLTTAISLDRVKTVVAEFHHQLLDIQPEHALAQVMAHGGWSSGEFIAQHLFVLRR
jgi:FkbM family methyltransferase